ncbi:DEAD/DEAH box helicase [Candidatus Odyssella thessalonicensis]|uniref:DEAD/DEAH box helicase n=1 Tax=Candidatus Odyssella thessalonicensis TaxID=84647 RepID=UPI001C305DAD|nr:DEAD/DEAH box helicase [Candidatus Odyssella thessalonicensis]
MTNTVLIPKLYLFSGEVKVKDKPWSAAKGIVSIMADLSAEQGGRTVRAEGGSDAELQPYIDQLLAIGWVPIKTLGAVIDPNNLAKATHVLVDGDHSIAQLAREFYLVHMPKLQEQGWVVTVDDSFPFRPVEIEGEWYANLDKALSTTTDWFDLELGMMIEGERVNILPLLVRMLREEGAKDQFKSALNSKEGGVIYVPLTDGRLLPVPADKIRFIAQTLIELHDADSLTDEGKLRLSSWQSTQLVEIEAAMQAAQMRWFGDEQVRELGAKLKDFTKITPVEPPKGLQCELRCYQGQGLSWLQFLRENNLNGILADDMGLGKTVQALSHILKEKESGRMDKPILVVAPTSLMVNWRHEAAKYAPELKVLTLHGQERKDLFDQIHSHDLILTTYPLLSRDKEFLIKHEFHMLILDEAQVIKNPNTMAHRTVQQINARHRLCLTGTPMENHLGELWALFYFLMPGFLGDQKKFNQIFRVPIEKQNDDVRRENLARRIKPFMLRRTKSQVVSELPPKTEIIQNIELQPEQRALYESIRLTMHERVRQEIQEKGLNKSHIVILDALLKLRQVCCDPRLLKLEAARGVLESAKVQFLRDTLPGMIAEGRQILLFSQFTSMLALIEEELAQIGIPFAKLTGQTKDRGTPIEEFQSGRVPVFLISLKAGGTGLNLTAADTVIHFDPWWNPAVENQATDRAYRIGQDKPVFVYKLITIGTVEEKIMLMQQRKASLLSGIFDGQKENDGLFNADDLEALFEPLP